MKTLALTSLATALLTFNIAGAASTPTSSEIFEAIDGESYGSHVQSATRVNFAVTAEDLQTMVNTNDIFEAIDGESYGSHLHSASRVNYQISADDMKEQRDRRIPGLPETYD